MPFSYTGEFLVSLYVAFFPSGVGVVT